MQEEFAVNFSCIIVIVSCTACDTDSLALSSNFGPYMESFESRFRSVMYSTAVPVLVQIYMDHIIVISSRISVFAASFAILEHLNRLRSIDCRTNRCAARPMRTGSMSDDANHTRDAT